MSIRTGLCRFFLFFSFFCSVFGFGLCCCVGLEEWERWARSEGWKGERLVR